MPAAALLALAGHDWITHPDEPKAWAVISAFVALVLLMGLYGALAGPGGCEGGEQ